jgi:hypothetical protein
LVHKLSHQDPIKIPLGTWQFVDLRVLSAKQLLSENISKKTGDEFSCSNCQIVGIDLTGESSDFWQNGLKMKFCPRILLFNLSRGSEHQNSRKR